MARGTERVGEETTTATHGEPAGEGMTNLAPPTSSFLLATGLALASICSAQGAAGPGLWQGTRPATGLSPGRLGVAGVHQIHMVRLPEDPAGSWRCALTVDGLAASRGGRGGLDFLTGLYDPETDTFAADGDAATLNTAGDEFGLMLHAEGLLAAYERAGQVVIGKRLDVQAPWQALGPVRDLPVQSYYDPALANVDGRLHLLFNRAPAIDIVEIELVSLSLVGQPTPVVLPARAGSFANSPTPIVDANGNLVGLSHHDVLGADNDHYLALDLDPATPSLPAVDSPGWSHNGGFAGGAFFAAERAPTGNTVSRTGLSWMPPARGRPGDDLFLEVFANAPTVPEPMNPPPGMLTPRFLPAPISIPGFENVLGVDPLGMLLVFGTVDHSTGRAGIWIPIPPDPWLAGVELAAQALLLAQGRLQFTNTAPVQIRSGDCVDADCDATVEVPLGRTVPVSVGPVLAVANGISVCNPAICSAVWGQAGFRQKVDITGVARGSTKVKVKCDVGGGRIVTKVICVTVT